MKNCWRSIATGVALAGALAASAAPPDIRAFFKPAEWNAAELSPDGTRLAAALSPDGTRLAVVVRTQGQRGKLAIVDISDPAKTRIVAGFADADVRNALWVNDHRLV